jgi:hypothetical protein
MQPKNFVKSSSPAKPSLFAVGDSVTWKGSDADVPAGTVGTVSKVFGDGDVEVTFAAAVSGGAPHTFTFLESRIDRVLPRRRPTIMFTATAAGVRHADEPAAAPATAAHHDLAHPHDMPHALSGGPRGSFTDARGGAHAPAMAHSSQSSSGSSSGSTGSFAEPGTRPRPRASASFRETILSGGQPPPHDTEPS